ncbi:MAG: 2-(hydroxymethyl)glutarate dehydrogenase [Alphaproteobacteria bacterium MarineAlpha5_Bin6]|nr:MAG: 2-(hydroxymethyl)glutarate dehydrogenase [Alphaproteobacteria bacterium MarineAlpha5_Bin7]PPR53667.1 MAG: 2-(hydroxymethyl)glutarate dehydrogenase [Alphaproteobacteria bacterium MarineAlpha5_Bin6]|tara:strand:+ start:1075 stop:1947 length:873 start_codon:yes stop_codon:yes gene_type:complete
MSVRKVSFIGLGVMGYPMAGYLKKNNYEVTVFNRTSSKSEKWVDQFQGLSENTPGKACVNSEIVFICVGKDSDLQEVMEGEEGILKNINNNSIIVDHTTASANIARKYFEESKKKNIHFLDAPISGGQAGAENGQLSVMVGGEEEPFRKAKPVISSYSKAIELIGPSGSGQLTKMVNQICIAGLVQGLSEAMAFGKKSDLDMEKVLKVISKGAAQSWQMENRYRTMLDGKFDFGFAVDWMRKDLSICFEEANKNGAKLPVTEIVDQFYSKVQSAGGNRFDTSSLMTLVDD